MALIIQTVEGVVSNKFEIGDEPLIFGRSPKNQVQIDDLAVSNEHAQISVQRDDNGKEVFSSRIWVVPMAVLLMKPELKSSSYIIMIF